MSRELRREIFIKRRKYCTNRDNHKSKMIETKIKNREEPIIDCNTLNEALMFSNTDLLSHFYPLVCSDTWTRE